MKYLKTVSHLLQLVMTPLRSNWAFFTFIYLLGCICAWVTLPDARGAKLYDNLYPELFLDVYVLATILTILPRRVKPWIRGFFYFVLYTAAVVDVYCFVKFQSTLTPTSRTRYLPNKVVGLTKDRSFQSVSVSPSHAYLYNMNKIVLQLLFITLVNFHKILWVQRN